MTQAESFDIIIEQTWEHYSDKVLCLANTMMLDDEDESVGIWAQIYLLFKKKCAVCPELLNNADDTRSWLLRETREACERRDRFLAYFIRANRETWLSKMIRKLKFKF